MRIFLRRDITLRRCSTLTHASRKPSGHAGLQQHAMLRACASRTRTRFSRAFGIVVRTDVRAARCVSKKTMRRCDNAREFFTLNSSIRMQSMRSTHAYRCVERVDDAADMHLEHRRCAPREVDAIAMANSMRSATANRVPRIRRARWLRYGSTHRCVRERESHRRMRSWCRRMRDRRLGVTTPNCRHA